MAPLSIYFPLCQLFNKSRILGGCPVNDMIDFEDFVFDLDSGNKSQLDENMLKVFGAWIQYLLEKMFKGTRVPVRVVGNRIQVDRFTSTLIGEKKYMDAIKRYGLDSAMTYKSRAKLNRSIQKFEEVTGISWPLK